MPDALAQPRGLSSENRRFPEANANECVSHSKQVAVAPVLSEAPTRVKWLVRGSRRGGLG